MHSAELLKMRDEHFKTMRARDEEIEKLQEELADVERRGTAFQLASVQSRQILIATPPSRHSSSRGKSRGGVPSTPPAAVRFEREELGGGTVAWLGRVRPAVDQQGGFV